MRWEGAEDVNFSSMCCILLTQIFFIGKLLPNVNKQLNKEQKLSASKGLWVWENEVLEFGSLLLQKALVKTEKNPCTCTKRVLHLKSTSIIHLSEQWALGPAAPLGVEQTSGGLLDTFSLTICKTQQRYCPPPAESPSRQPTEPVTLPASESRSHNEISETRQQQEEAE